MPTIGALPATTAPTEADDAIVPEVRIFLRSGRELHCGDELHDAVLRRLLHVLETA